MIINTFDLKGQHYAQIYMEKSEEQEEKIVGKINELKKQYASVSIFINGSNNIIDGFSNIINSYKN